jgi:hypothetical protein
MPEPSILSALVKIGEGVNCIAISTIIGVKHLVVAIKNNPHQVEKMEEWELVHRMERGELINNQLVDEKVSHNVIIDCE